MNRGIGAMIALAATGLAAPATAGPCRLGRILELPVGMQGMRPIVAAGIDGRDAPFIVDSGAFFSTISPGVARAFGLKLNDLPPEFRVSGIGGTVEAKVTRVRRFTLAGITIPNIQFLVGGSDVGQTGLLGQNVLGLADVEYDLPGGAVRLFRPRGCDNADMAYWSGGKPSFTVDVEPVGDQQRHTIATVELDGAKLSATFDTGAEMTVVSVKAAARAGIRPGDPRLVAAGWASGLGSRMMRGWTAPFGLLRIGSEELRNIRLHVGELPPGTDMLIGADYFVSHRIYVSNAQHRLYFTYTGGRLFDARARLDAAAPVAVSGGHGEVEPTDAQGFAARGAMYQTQRDLPRAIGDFSRAIELAPGDASHPYRRAVAYLQTDRPALALQDLDTALRLAPGDIRARLLRAQVALDAGRQPAALADLDVLAAALPRTDMARLEVGQLYTSADALPRAIAQYDLWLDTHAVDARRDNALNARCWARALLGQDLARARADCTAAIRTMPGNADYLDSRGLVALRLDDLDAAIADYDRALAVDPRTAWSLYGRGLAARRKGLTASADRDIAAALAIDPGLAARAKRYGIE